MLRLASWLALLSTTFTFELSLAGSPRTNVEYDYVGKQSIPTTGLSPASPTALWAAEQRMTQFPFPLWLVDPSLPHHLLAATPAPNSLRSSHESKRRVVDHTRPFARRRRCDDPEHAAGCMKADPDRRSSHTLRRGHVSSALCSLQFSICNLQFVLIASVSPPGTVRPGVFRFQNKVKNENCKVQRGGLRGQADFRVTWLNAGDTTSHFGQQEESSRGVGC